MAITKNTQKPETAARPITFNGQKVNVPTPKPAMRPTGGPTITNQGIAGAGGANQVVTTPSGRRALGTGVGPASMYGQPRPLAATPQQATAQNPVPSLHELVQIMSKHVTGIQGGFQKWVDGILAGMRQSSQSQIPINPNPVSGPVLGTGMGALQELERQAGQAGMKKLR